MPATNKIPVKNNIFLIIYLLFRIGNILRFRLAGRYDLEKSIAFSRVISTRSEASTHAPIVATGSTAVVVNFNTTS